MTAHIIRNVTKKRITHKCGKVVLIPTKLQSKITFAGAPNTINPEWSNCPECLVSHGLPATPLAYETPS